MPTTSDAGRDVQQLGRRRRLASPSTWIAAVAALVLSAAIALAMAPAEASSTVNVQLTLSGVASPDNPTGGSQVGVHPGDTVILHASAIPTAGAPAGLSNALAGLVAGVAGVQVKILSGNLPGVGYPITLGRVPNCGGRASLPLRSLAKGTYSFRYVVEKVSVLTSLLGKVTGCKKTTVTPTRDQLGTLTRNNVKVSDNAVYSGSIVVATNPPAGRIGVQLPKQSIRIKAGPLHTSVRLPGANVGVPNPVPGITKGLGKLPGVGQLGGLGGSRSGSGGVNYRPPSLTVPQRVMPHAVNFGGAAGERYVARGPASVTGGHIGGHVVAPAEKATTTAAPAAHPSEVAQAQPGKKTVNLGEKDGLGKALPIVLAVAAILALTAVTAGYARMMLLRRH